MWTISQHFALDATGGRGLLEWSSTITALFAVFVAIFSEKIAGLWRGKPKLVLLKMEETSFLENGEDNAKFYLFVLCAENLGKAQAKGAEVFIESIEEVGSDRHSLVTAFVPMSLRWADSPRNGSEIFANISPNLRRYFFLGALRVNSSVYFELWTESRRSQSANILRPGKYKINLLLANSETLPNKERILLHVPSHFDPKVVDIKRLDLKN